MKQRSYPQQVAVPKKSANGPAKGIVAVEPFSVPEKPTILEGVRAKVFSDRYSWKDEVGKSIEKYPEQMWGRVAKAISSVEKTPQLRKIWQEKFYDALSGFKFLPGGRILSAAGTGYEVTFYNCFVIPSPEDSRGGIIDNLKVMIEIMSRAGGVGINLSTLRPRGARVHKVNGTSSGPVNWANLYSVGTHDVIQQGGCFTGDSLIMTHLGLVAIKEIIQTRRDWYVATHKGYKKVTAKFDNGVKKVYQVKTEAGFKVNVTAEHRFLTFDRDGQFYLQPLAEFKEGGRIVLLLGDWSQDIPYVPLNTYLPKPSKYSYGRIKVNLPKFLYRELAFLIGVYDADGSKVQDEYSQVGKGLRIAVAGNRTKDLKTLTKTLKGIFGLEPKVDRGDGDVYNICIYSREVNEFLNLNGLLKQSSVSVEVPKLIFSSPKEVVEGYIAGVFSGDGGNRGGKGGFRLSTVSEKFAHQLQLLLLNLGIPAKIQTQIRDNKNWHPLHTVTINGHRFMEKFSKLIASYTEKINDKPISVRDGAFNWPINLTERFVYLTYFQRTIARTNPTTSQKAILFLEQRQQIIHEEDKTDVELFVSCVSDQIASIDLIGEENVYDAEVDGVHLLSGNGFYTSNSRRGALMLMLNDWHPDVEEFIEIKKDLSRINGANLSVCVSDGFMEAVEKDLDWTLRFPDTKFPGYDELWDGDILDWEAKGYPVKIYKVIKAKEIWEKICQAAWTSAEPGLHFLERSNKQSNTWYFEKLLATNPCVTGDTWVHTVLGPKQVIDLLGRPFLALVNGQNKLSGPNGFFRTGTKEVVRIKTEEGFHLRLTSDHLILTVSEMTRNTLKAIWYKARELKKGDKIVLHNHRSNPYWSGQYTFNDGYLLGLLLGDGTLKHDKAVLSVWTSSLNTHVQGVMQQTLQATSTVPHRSDFNGWMIVRGRTEYGLANTLGLQHGNKTVTPLVEKTSSNFYRGFLRGLFDCDGSVQGNQSKGVSIRLAQSDLPMLFAVQRMLLRLGIVSQIYQNRRKAGKRLLPDGKGGLRKYSTKAQHELVISGDNLLIFAEVIGFADEAKSKKLKIILRDYKRGLNRERFIAKVNEVVADGVEDVYDAQILGVNAFDANGLYTHNCGEQPLGAWAVCNLGALNLSSFVEDGQMNYARLAEYAAIATRFLDNVVDANFYFYEDNEKQQKGIRRTGLGTMGLGDALIKMKLRYGSDQSLEVIEKIYKTIRDASYEASADLAAEKGPFPKFDKDNYLQGYFIKQLPDVIKEKIAKGGIRNAVVLTQAPTGTTSLLAGVSSGIEPVYDFKLIRRDRTGEHVIYHPSYREWQEANPGVNEMPHYFVAANDLTPDDHVRVQAMIQKYTDSSISKTVNAPNSHTVDQVRELYMKAYKLGCKGVTYMRDGSREGVLSHADEKPKTSEQPATLLQPTHRPAVLNGRTYKMLTPVGEAFITINRDEMGQPMEVFATIGKAGMQTGADAEAIGRLISLALRVADGSRMDVAKKIISQLRGIGGSSQVGFGKNRVMSLGDAIAKVLAEELSLASDDSGQILTLDLSAEQLSIVETKATLARGDLCPECGESTFVLEEGCSKCYSCGYSKC